MLAILNIWLCLFSENSSILNKMSILGQAPKLCKVGSNKCHQIKLIAIDHITIAMIKSKIFHEIGFLKIGVKILAP